MMQAKQKLSISLMAMILILTFFMMGYDVGTYVTSKNYIDPRDEIIRNLAIVNNEYNKIIKEQRELLGGDPNQW